MRIPSTVWREIIEHVTSVLPREGVGALVEWGAGTLRFIPLHNTSADEAHYRIQPADWVSLLFQIEQTGERLLAIVHSHPTSVPLPSPQDIQEFYYPDSYMLIISLTDTAQPAAGLYKKNGQRFERCPLVID